MPVTTEQVRALRKADSICFDTGSHVQSHSGAQIRAIVRGKDYEHEKTVTVNVDSFSVRDFGRDEGPYDCFEMAMHAQYTDVIRTLVRHVKTGSEIHLGWTRNNSSPVTAEAGLVVDHLDVTVRNGKTSDTFRVATSVTPDNTARMVRVA